MADTCPKCGQTGISSDKCPGCGVIIPLYEQYLEKVRQGPQRPGPTATARAIVPSAPQTATRPRIPTPTPTRVTPAAPVSARPAGGRRQPSFHGTGGALWRVQIVTMLLTLVTFGIYYPWAKTRVRQFMFAQTEFDGDRFAYHGTGKELFRGAFKASLIFGFPVMALNSIAAAAGGGVVTLVANLLVMAFTFAFLPMAIVGARRYRLSRTSWRGIRFSFRGHTKTFMGFFAKWMILSGVTLGLYYPILIARRHAFLTENSYFGNARFGFDGAPRALFRSFLRVLLVVFGAGILAAVFAPLAPPLAPIVLLLGIAGGIAQWIGFVAEKRRYFWDHTTVANARFRSSITAGALAKLWAVNVLLLAVTLGLAAPWVRVRSARFACERLTLEGAIDPAAIVQDARDAPATGEALSSLLDADIEIG